MSVTQVKERWKGDTAGGSITRRKLTRLFWVRTDSLSNRAADIEASGLLPQIGSSHPRDSSAIIVDHPEIFHMEDNPLDYEAVYTYEQRTFINADPLLRPAQRSASFMMRTEEYSKDESSPQKAVVNAAGVPIAPALQRNVADLAYTVRRNVASYSTLTARQYINKCNADVFNGHPAGECYLAQWGAEEMFDYSPSYWAETFEVWIKEGGWDEEVLNQGRQRLTYTVNPPRLLHIKEVDPDDPLAVPTPVSEDVALNANGSGRADPELLIYLTFRPYKRINFSGVIPF